MIDFPKIEVCVMKKRLDLTYKDKLNLYENKELNDSNYKWYRNIRWFPRVLFPASWLILGALNSVALPTMLLTLPLFVIIAESITGIARLAVSSAIKQNSDEKIGYKKYRQLVKNGQLKEVIDEIDQKLILQNNYHTEEMNDYKNNVPLSKEMLKRNYDKAGFIIEEDKTRNSDGGREL